MSCVLDAWALLAVLRAEPAGARVLAWTERRRPVVSWINLGEVLYQEARRLGDETAARAIEGVRAAVVAELPDEELVVAAASIKAAHSISYADCFAVATAERHELPLLTGDPDLVALDRPSLEVVDLR